MNEQKVTPYFEILDGIIIRQLEEIDDTALNTLLTRLDTTYAVYDSMSIIYADGYTEFRDLLLADEEFCDLLRRIILYYTRELFEYHSAHADLNVATLLKRGFMPAISMVRSMSSEEDILNERIISEDTSKLDLLVVLAIMVLELIRKTDFEEEGSPE